MLITKRPELIREEAAAVFVTHGEPGVDLCPFPSGYQIGRSFEDRRVWWFEGFLEARTKARLSVKGMAID